MGRIRVLVADDHTIVRQGVVGILRRTEDLDVVAEAANGDEALAKTLETKPDVVVLDINMPCLNGFEAARRIRRTLADTRILILTMYDDAEYVLKMRHAGVAGYLVKDGAASELIDAIRTLKAGRTYFGPQATKALTEAYQQNLSLPDDPYGRLTDRERQIFQLIVEGCTNAKIAERLYISPKTVDNHRTHLMNKLGLHCTADLLRYAARHGLI
jgi:DNA-binding NarL/FixJ family response regulator